WNKPVYITSIPASRSARASTFAPRSWPSSPALATMTRSGRSLVVVVSVAALISELRRLGVAAVHAHHRVDDLALGGDRLHAVDQERHHVRLAGARAFQRRERRLDGRVVAVRAHVLHRARLTALDLRADLEQVGILLLVGALERVDAHDHALARFDRPLVAVR